MDVRIMVWSHKNRGSQWQKKGRTWQSLTVWISMCWFRIKQITIMSESASTLTTLHATILSEATAAHQRVNSSFHSNPSSLQHCLSKVWPKLKDVRDKQQAATLLEPLLVGMHSQNSGSELKAVLHCMRQYVNPYFILRRYLQTCHYFRS